MTNRRNHSFRVSLGRGILALGIALCGIFGLAAQEGESARIYYAEGGDFDIALGGVRTLVAAGTVTGTGLRLERAAIVHTGPETRVEIQLIPSGTVLKLAENTSLVYNGFDETGGFTDLGLLYGRLRLCAGDETDASGGSLSPGTLVVRSGGVAARFNGGDFGVDYVLDPDSPNSASRPLFRVCAFRGGAEIIPYGKEGIAAYFGGAGAVSIGNWESLSLDVSSSHTFAEKKAMNEEAADYWRLHNFAGTPPYPMPESAITAPVIASAEPAPAAPAQPAGETIIRYVPVEPTPSAVSSPGGRKSSMGFSRTSRNVCLAVGLLLSASAAVVQGISYSQFDTDRDETARSVFTGAYPVLGLGLVTTLVGVLYNPQTE